MEFEHTSVLITGASRGIGEHIAYEFASKTSHPLILLSRSEDDLEKVKKQCIRLGALNVFIQSCDLTDENDVNAIVLPDGFSNIGVLINNTGSFLAKSLRNTTLPEFYKQFDVNVVAAFNTTKRFLSNMETASKGYIINICSVASLAGSPGSGAYVTSKHAVLGFTRSLRQELKPKEIAVTALNLSSTYSTSWEGSGVEATRLIDPDDVAKLIRNITEMSSRSVIEEVIIRPMLGDY